MITAHREDTLVAKDGTLTLKNLPFTAGDAVEVIVLPRVEKLPQTNPYPLRGSVLRFSDPTAPAASPEEWDANA